LLGPGRTLHFHATDTAPEAAVEWLIDLTGLLLVIYRRRPTRSEGIEVLGDVQLLDFWLEQVSFG
jgi:hypothetical protein